MQPASLLLRARTRFAQTARAGVGGTPAALLLFSFAGILLFFFDPATAGFYPPCLFRTFLGMQCPGCGSLRAAHQLLHGNFQQAWALNKPLLIALPLAAAISLFIILRNPNNGATT